MAKWRRELDERAEAGLREAFRFLRQDDDPDREICSMGVGQVLSANCAIWAKLWEVDPRLGTCRVGQEARTAAVGHQVRRVAASTWRLVSASFPAGTSCLMAYTSAGFGGSATPPWSICPPWRLL